MEHVLLLHSNAEGYPALSPEEIDKMYAEHQGFQTALTEAGVARSEERSEPRVGPWV
jgi:hypothetical protein